MTLTNPLPDRVQVVIIGGGVVGCSVAYHLAHRGWTDLLLLERNRLTSGTTWHAAGLVGQLRATANMTRLAQYATELYKGLEEETGQNTGFIQRGSVTVAGSDARWDEIRRTYSTAKCFGLETTLLDPAAVQGCWPLVNIEGIRGGIWLPKDGQVNPTDLTQALIKGALRRGVTVREHTPVTRLKRARGRITGVETVEGAVEAEYVVGCCGMWARQLGRSAGLDVPLQAAEHFYVVTEVLPDPPGPLPVVRDPDNAIYFKEDAGKLLIGMFEPSAKPWGIRGIPHNASFTQLPDDWDHIAPQLEAAMDRVPLVAQVGIQLFFNGPESFTPDGQYLLGEMPELRGFFVASGFNSMGIQSAGGAGRMLADWIVDGYPPMDLSDVDVRRMFSFQNTTNYLRDRTVETPGLLYRMHWPHRQYETARPARQTPLHGRLKAIGAAFGEGAGWERPDFFGKEGSTPVYDYSFRRPSWFEQSAAEHRAAREDLALFDQTSFTKLLVQGPDAETALQYVCSNQVNVEPGRVVYCLLLNERGTIEDDVTVTRLDDERYLIVASAAAQRRDYYWLRRAIPGEYRVAVTDVTSAEAVIGIMGPRSREFLQQISGADISNEACPFAHWVDLDIGYVRVRAVRMTYVGELGWEIYVPIEFTVGVFDTLMAAESPPTLAGFHALHSLRTESGYRHWGQDITAADEPFGAGLGFAVARDKEFIGREAIECLRDQARRRRLVSFKLDDPDLLTYHDEPIFFGDRIVGRTTSGRYGHTVGAAVGFAWVEHPEGGHVDKAFLRQDGFSVEVAGEQTPIRISLRPFYDPDRERVKG